MSSWLDDLNKESLEGHKGALETLIENAEEKIEKWREELSEVEGRISDADDEKTRAEKEEKARKEAEEEKAKEEGQDPSQRELPGVTEEPLIAGAREPSPELREEVEHNATNDPAAAGIVDETVVAQEEAAKAEEEAKEEAPKARKGRKPAASKE